MPQIPNVRDVGGIAAAAGTLRTGVLLRSALPADDDTVPAGLAWPPALVVDLRSPIERGEVHPLEAHSGEVANIALLAELRPDTPWPATLSELYLAILDDASHLLVDLVALVAAQEGTTLIHCAAGKDRTGVAVALVLRLLGVDRELVIADYLRTADAAEAIKARIGTDDIPAHFYEVPVEAIAGVLDVWDAHPDGTVGWYLDRGGSSEDLSQLGKRLLV